MRELFNGKDAYVIINYSNKTHLIRHNVTRAFEDDYKNGKFETKKITIFDEKPHHFYVDNYDGTIQINSVVFVSEKNNKTIVRYPYRQEVMNMMRIKFDTTNAAFDEECGGGLEWQSIEILKEIIEKLENGTKEGNCFDVNGNKVGEWNVMEECTDEDELKPKKNPLLERLDEVRQKEEYAKQLQKETDNYA